jgi:hypothetical protein
VERRYIRTKRQDIRPHNQQTIYTLSCNALDSSTYSESTTVNLVPAYQEK